MSLKDFIIEIEQIDSLWLDKKEVLKRLNFINNSKKQELNIKKLDEKFDEIFSGFEEEYTNGWIRRKINEEKNIIKMEEFKQKLIDYLKLKEDIKVKPDNVLISVIGRNIEITFKNQFNIDGLDSFILENIEEAISVSKRVDWTYEVHLKDVKVIGLRKDVYKKILNRK